MFFVTSHKKCPPPPDPDPPSGTKIISIPAQHTTLHHSTAHRTAAHHTALYHTTPHRSTPHRSTPTVWCAAVRCGAVWCAEGAVTKRQWLGCLASGNSKMGRGVCVCAHYVLVQWAAAIVTPSLRTAHLGLAGPQDIGTDFIRWVVTHLSPSTCGSRTPRQERASPRPEQDLGAPWRGPCGSCNCTNKRSSRGSPGRL